MESEMKDLPSPITREVISAGLKYIVREMRSTLIRSSYAPILFETHDFSCALCDVADGQVVAMHVDVPMHIFPTIFTVQHLKEVYGDDIHEGDIFFINDPTYAGTHMNDIMMLKPIFVNGKLELFAAVRAHYTDIGGTYPGSSVSASSTEILHEGTRIPISRVYSKGVANEEFIKLFMANMRQPFDAKGIFAGQVLVCGLAEKRVAELYERYGRSVVRAVQKWDMERARDSLAVQIAKLPQGEFYYEDYLENSGVSGENSEIIFVRSKMITDGERVSISMEDASPQRAGIGNASAANTWCGAYTVLETMLGNGLVTNTGATKQLEVATTPYTVVDCRYPAPVGGFADMMFGPIQGSALGLLSQAAPDEVCALGGSSANQLVLTGVTNPDREGDPWYIFEFPFAGWPAGKEHDGNIFSSQWCMGDLPCLWPIERVELLNPLRMVCNELLADSGGPGERRGGVGVQRAWMTLEPCTMLLLGSDGILPRPGSSMGYGGSLNEVHVLRDGVRLDTGSTPMKMGPISMQPGDVVVMLVAGGGGFGDPLDRSVRDVLGDYEDGYVSTEGALSDYGVVIKGGTVDIDATEQQRSQLRASRANLVVAGTDTDDFDDSQRRLVRVSAETAATMNVVEGDVVEYVPPRGAGLRAWVHIDSSLQGNATVLGPIGRQICSVEDGEEIWVRRPWTWNSREARNTERFREIHEISQLFGAPATV